MNKPKIDNDITPDTKIAELLKHYPDLEDRLIELSPAFAKLRNPILRKTVAKVANLRQAAQIGNVPLAKMINTLRSEAGLGEAGEIEEEAQTGAGDEPDWVQSFELKETFDARSMIESGGHPLNRVLEDLDKLGDSESYQLITPFLPAPLLDMAKSKGFEAWSQQERDDLVKNYFKRMK